MRKHGPNCSCTSCVFPSDSDGSTVDQLQLGKDISLKERKLLEKLIKTRAAYDDVRRELLLSSSLILKEKKRAAKDDDAERKSSAQAIKDIVNLVDRGGASGPTLGECCSCCICNPDDPHAHGRHHKHRHPTRKGHTSKHIDSKPVNSIESHRKRKTARSFGKTSKKKGYKTARKKVSIKSAKPRRIRSAPCLCTCYGLGDSIKHKSKAAIRRIRGQKEKGIATKSDILDYLPTEDAINKRKGLKGVKESVTASYENLKEKLKESQTQLKRRLDEESRAMQDATLISLQKAIETGEQVKKKLKKGAKASLEKIKKLEPGIKQSIEKIKDTKRKIDDIRKMQIEKLRKSRKDRRQKKSVVKVKQSAQIKPKMTDSACNFECYPDECDPEECLEIMQREKRKRRPEGLITKSGGDVRKQKIKKGSETASKGVNLRIKQKAKSSTKKELGDEKKGTARLVESKTNIRSPSPKPKGTVTISDTRTIGKKQHVTRGSQTAIHVLKRCLCSLKIKAKKSKKSSSAKTTSTSSSNFTMSQPRMQCICKPAYVTKSETNRRKSTISIHCSCKPKGIQRPSQITVKSVTENSDQKRAEESRKDRSLWRKKSQQSISTTKSKYSATKHRLQRCFCTLKLKTGKGKNKFQPISQTTISSQSRSTQVEQQRDKNLKTSKPRKLLSNECECLPVLQKREGSVLQAGKVRQLLSNECECLKILQKREGPVTQAEKVRQKKDKNRNTGQPRKLLPHECECLPTLHKQEESHIRRLNKKSSTGNHKTSSKSSFTSTSVTTRSIRVKSTAKTTKTEVPSRKPRKSIVLRKLPKEVKSSESSPNRRAVRIASTFSFNIEFVKNKPDVPESYSKITMPTQIEKKEKGTTMGSALVKCFCTLNFLKNTKEKKKTKEILTTSREISIKDGTTPTMVTKGTTTKHTKYKPKPIECECLEGMKRKGHSKEFVQPNTKYKPKLNECECPDTKYKSKLIECECPDTKYKPKLIECECLEGMKRKGHSKELVQPNRPKMKSKSSVTHISTTSTRTGNSRAKMKSKSSVMRPSRADSGVGTSRTKRRCQWVCKKESRERKYCPSTCAMKPSHESFSKGPLCHAVRIGSNFSFKLEFSKNTCQPHSSQKQKKKYRSSLKVYTVSRMTVAKTKITSQTHEATGKTEQNESTLSLDYKGALKNKNNHFGEENLDLSDDKDSEPYNLPVKSSHITRNNSLLKKCFCTMNINSDGNRLKVGPCGCDFDLCKPYEYGLSEWQPLLINRLNADKISSSDVRTRSSNCVSLLSSRRGRRLRSNIRLRSLKTILTRKPDSATRIQHNLAYKTQKQVIHVNSAFSVDIEFSKNKKQLVTDHHDEPEMKYFFNSESTMKSKPDWTKARKTSCHNRISQSVITVTESRPRASTLKKCYCKLMLQKRAKNMKTGKNDNHNTSCSTATTSESGRHYRETATATINCLNRPGALDCHEGKHNVCIQHILPNCRNRTDCGDVAKFNDTRSAHSVQCLFSNRQIVRIGSSYSFNIQFHKEKKRHKMYSKRATLQRIHRRKHQHQYPTSRKIQYSNKGSTLACLLPKNTKLKLADRRTSTSSSPRSCSKIAETSSSHGFNQDFFKQQRSASVIFSTNSGGRPSSDLTKSKFRRIVASQKCHNVFTTNSFMRKKVFQSTNTEKLQRRFCTFQKKMYHQPNIFGRSVATQIKQVYRLETKPRLRLRSSECYPYECSRIPSSASYRARKHKSGGKKKEMKVILSPKDKSTKRGKNKSEPYECEAGICAPYPGQCDPHECLKKMKKKAMQSAKTGSTQYNEQDRNNRTPYIVEAPRFKALDNPLRQTVRITSSFSLNVEFCKDILPEGLVDTKDQMCQIDCGPQMIHASVYQDTYDADNQLKNETRTKSVGTGQPNMLQRCFCTAKLQKKFTATKETSTKETSTKKSKPLPKAKEASVGTKSKIHKCGPGFCVPGVCDPYECVQKERKPGASLAPTTLSAYRQFVESETPRVKRCIDTQCYLDPRRCRNSQCQARPEKKTKTVALQPPQRPPHSGRPSRGHSRRPGEHRGRPDVDPNFEPDEPPEEHYPNRQCVRYGSAFSFEIEFFKEKALEALKKYRPVRNEHVQYEPKRRRAVQLGSPGKDDLRHQNKTRNVSTGSKTNKLKRCFCAQQFKNSPYVYSSIVHYCGFDLKPKLTKLKSKTQKNHECLNSINKFPSKPAALNIKCKKLQCDFKTKKDVEVPCISAVVCEKARKKSRPAVRKCSTMSKIEFKKQVFPQQHFERTEKTSESRRCSKLKEISRKEKKIQEKQFEMANIKWTKTKSAEQIYRSQIDIKNKKRSVDNALKRCFCTLKHQEKKTPKKIIKQITCRRAEVQHDIQMSALYRSRTASKLDHKILGNVLPSRKNACSTNRKAKFQNFYESKTDFGEMQTIFPYISNKFNKDDSKTVVFKGQAQKSRSRVNFSPVSIKTYQHSIDNKKFKRLAKEDIDNRQKRLPREQEIEGSHSNTKFSIKSFIRRITRFFKNSPERNIFKEDNVTKSTELYHDIRKSKKKKRKNDLKLWRTDVLKTSKSDRPANHNIISTPKKTKSLKMAKESHKYKNDKDHATHHEEGLKKYSKFQSGDAERKTFSVSNFYAPTPSPFINKHNNKCICTYCKCQYKKDRDNKDLPIIKGATTSKVNKVRFKENQDANSDHKKAALAIKKASHPSGECKDLMFQMNLDPCNMSILNREEIATKVKELKEHQKSELANLKPREIKELHGKSCNCCICKSFKKKSIIAKGQAKVKRASVAAKKSVKKIVPVKKIIQKIEGREPCICGSQVCEKEAMKLANSAKARKAMAARREPCICGTKICEAESFKAALEKGVSKKVLLQQQKIRKQEQKAKEKEIKMKKEAEKMKKLIEEKKQEEIKKKNDAIIAAKEFVQRQKRYKKEDAARRRKQAKNEKEMDKQVEKFKDTSTWVLAGESAIDIGKLAFRGVAGVFRTLGRLVIDPKRAVQQYKDARRDPGRVLINIKESLSDNVGPVARRVSKRMAAMVCCRKAKETMEEYAWSNYMLHMLDKDPKKRIFRKKKWTRKREPVDFECSLYMASLRKKPWLWAYYKCPWFYPHCVSVAALMRSFIELVLIILAVAVWSPCLFVMEACRATMCCTMCTG